MKKLSLFALIFISLLSLNCSDENSLVDETSNKKVESNLRVAASTLPKSGIIFAYKNNSEFVANAAQSLKDLAVSNRSEVQNANGSFTRIFDRITIENGKGILKERHFFNDATNTVVRSHIFNLSTGEYDLANVNVPPASANPSPLNLFGCPQGYTNMGSCGYDEFFATCVSQTVAGHQSTILNNGVINTSRYQFMYTSSGAYICGQ